MDDKLQNEDLVKHELAELDRQKTERRPWEVHWREIEERVHPVAAGGFTPQSPGNKRGQRNFDMTAVKGLQRFALAMSDITIPVAQQYIRVRFADADLMKLPEVQRWCDYAGDRLYAIRYAPHAMFGAQSFGDFLQTGSYGTAPYYVGVMPGRGLFYQALPLAECYIDEDYAGRVDTVRREYKKTARQLRAMFGEAALTPRMLDALKTNRGHVEFTCVHVVRPVDDYTQGAMDVRGKPVMSLTFAAEEKVILRRGGYYSSPISVSRHVTAPGEKYGRSVAMDYLPSIQMANAQAQTITRAGHKAVDPALAFYNDDGITRLVTRPGGMNPGLVNDDGRLLVQPIPGGGSLPVGMELLQAERANIDDGFLGAYFKLLTDDKVQRSAAAILEIASKQGVLVGPYGSRYQAEKLNPITQREYEEALRAGQIDPPPPVVAEAGDAPIIEYENPLTRMARAQEAAGLSRLIETLAPFAQSDPNIIGDVINIEEAAPGVASVLGVRQSWTRTPEEIAARRRQREQQQAEAATIEQLQGAAGATLDLVKAGATQQAGLAG